MQSQVNNVNFSSGSTSRNDILRQRLNRHTISLDSPDILHRPNSLVMPSSFYGNSSNCYQYQESVSFGPHGNSSSVPPGYGGGNSSHRSQSFSSNTGNVNLRSSSGGGSNTSLNRRSYNFDEKHSMNGGPWATAPNRASSNNNSRSSFHGNSGTGGSYATTTTAPNGGGGFVSGGSAAAAAASFGSVNRVRLATKEKGKIPESISLQDLEGKFREG